MKLIAINDFIYIYIIKKESHPLGVEKMVPAFAFEVGRSSLEIGEKKHFPPSTKIETNKTN